MRYPNLMAYIANRSDVNVRRDWCAQLHLDEAEAERGGLADVAAEMAAAQESYRVQEQRKGRDGFPYNSAMGKFLGLPLRDNGEPPHGYYMAGCVMHHFRAGVARREIEKLVAEGRELSLVVGRSRKHRKPIRFARFSRDQIAVTGRNVVVNDGKRKITLSSNWSEETCLEAVAKAMRSGAPYGE